MRDYIRKALAGNTSILVVGAEPEAFRREFDSNGRVWNTVTTVEHIPHGVKYDVAVYLLDYSIGFATIAAAELSAVRRSAVKTIVVIDEETHTTWSQHDLDYVFSDAADMYYEPGSGTVRVYVQPKEPIKIAVYAISKNESAFVERFCKSANDADLIVIGDTGSDDSTVELAQRRGATVYNIAIKPWRFDHARNAVLALIPADVDVCIPMDLDEMLEPGWREEVERLWVKGKTTRLQHTFDWGQGIKFRYDKIHSRTGYHWHHPCHEYVRKDPRTVERHAISDMVLITHHPDNTKSRSHYMELLELSVQEDPYCPRNAFYYARELNYAGQHREAIEAFDRFLVMPNATFVHDRAFAYRLLGASYEAISDSTQAMKHYRLGVAELPTVRESWSALAYAAYRQCDWPEVYAASLKALSINYKELVYTMDPGVWGPGLHDLHALASYHLKQYDRAVEHGEIAVKLGPDDERLAANLELYRKKLQE